MTTKKHKLILGDCNFEKRKDITDLGVLEIIYGQVDFDGDAYFRDSNVENLGNLRVINGYADFRNSKLKSLGNLTTIGGYADFRDSNVENLGKLTTIGGYASFTNSNVVDLGNLTTIGDDAYFNDSKVENLGNLTTIGLDIYANDNPPLLPEYKLTRQQVIDHLNKMNELFFVERNSLYYPVPNLSVFNIKKGIWKNEDAYIFAPNLHSIPLGKLSIDSDGSIISTPKKYS